MAKASPHHVMKYKICVSGAADSRHCSKRAFAAARFIGQEIVRHNGVVVTGATTGVPQWAALGAKEAGGFCIGLSPAASEQAHIRTYRLPVDHHDVIIYTGFGYSGRNLLLTRASDAVITICGRMGTLNEFTIAFEDRKPQGVLVGSGGMADRTQELVRVSGRGPGKLIYDDDPRRLVRRLLALVDREKVLRIGRANRVTTRYRRGSHL